METKDRKTVLVTGAAGGLGLAQSLALGRLGYAVAMVDVRGPEGLAAAERVRADTAGAQVTFLRADLSCWEGIDFTAQWFLAAHRRLDVLLNCVGGTFLVYRESPDGIELTWALNWLGHFRLTRRLAPVLCATAQATGNARVIEITSDVYRWSSPDLLRRQSREHYQGVMAYAQSKRALITFVAELARRAAGTGLTANAVAPGVVRTGIASSGNGPLARLAMLVINAFALSPAQGVAPIVRLAADPAFAGVSGKYFNRYKTQPDDPTCLAAGKELWDCAEAEMGHPNLPPFPMLK